MDNSAEILCMLFNLSDIRGGRELEKIYARKIFMKYYTEKKVSQSEIGRYLNLNHSTVNYHLGKYEDEYDTNPYFKEKVKMFMNLITINGAC